MTPDPSGGPQAPHGSQAQGQIVRAHVWVAGRVQGVFFRGCAEDKARAHGVSGWVRNARDGRVEAVFEGDRAAVEAMVRWCHRGSPGAVVSSVEVAWEEPRGERGFAVRF
ncbi:MAG TPA: acylphosphatase [Candidatus Sulfotelmatobacter sp.]|nr:acylphosphatase [Candidatus Sulfotelmatobacter sp.]